MELGPEMTTPHLQTVRVEFLFRQLAIGGDHESHEVSKVHPWLPLQNSLSPARVADQSIDRHGPKKSRIGFDILPPVQLSALKSDLQEFLHRMNFAGRDYEILGPLLLQHEEHGFDVVAGEAPVALRFRLPSDNLFWMPILIRPTLRVILRVTKFSPRRGDS
jgi:hypothetical protein